MFHVSKPVTRAQVQAAREIAIIVDVLQIVLFPVFVEGFISPVVMRGSPERNRSAPTARVVYPVVRTQILFDH